MSPVFSVIIPVYNAEADIEATVRSVLAQSFQDFELLLIDDGSSDGSLKKMLKLAEEDERIRLLSKANEGVSATRNMGVGMSRGQYLAFLDADDVWMGDKLAQHCQLGAAISYAQIRFLYEGRSQIFTYSTVPARSLGCFELLSENAVCTTSNLVVRRDVFEAVGGFDTGLNHAEDQDWLLRAARAGYEIAGIDRHLVDYRMSAGGLSADIGKMYAAWSRLADDCATHIDGEQRAQAEAIYLRYLARRALRTGGDVHLARRLALKGVRQAPAEFLKDLKRGGGTLVGALLSPYVPAALRPKVFA